MRKQWLFRWVPEGWRSILLLLLISAFSLLGFYIYSLVVNKSADGLIVILAGFHTLTAAYLLVLKAIEPEKPNRRSKLTAIIAAIALVIFVYLNSVGIFVTTQRDDARAQWTISNICTERGELRESILAECLKYKKGICMLGDTPMQPCEEKLRKQLKLSDRSSHS